MRRWKLSLYLVFSFLRCTFYSTGSSLSSAPSLLAPLLHRLLLLCFSNGNDRIFRWLKIWISKDASVLLLPLPSSLTLRSLCYANRDSECIWVGSIKPNGNSNGKATVTTNKRKPILSFWRLQTLFLQKSRICNWHLCTQRLEISQNIHIFMARKFKAWIREMVVLMFLRGCILILLVIGPWWSLLQFPTSWILCSTLDFVFHIWQATMML